MKFLDKLFKPSPITREIELLAAKLELNRDDMLNLVDVVTHDRSKVSDLEAKFDSNRRVEFEDWIEIVYTILGEYRLSGDAYVLPAGKFNRYAQFNNWDDNYQQFKLSVGLLLRAKNYQIILDDKFFNQNSDKGLLEWVPTMKNYLLTHELKLLELYTDSNKFQYTIVTTAEAEDLQLLIARSGGWIQ